MNYPTDMISGKYYINSIALSFTIELKVFGTEYTNLYKCFYMK